MNCIGIAIGGDVFPGSTLSDHVLRFNNIPQVQDPTSSAVVFLPFSCVVTLTGAYFERYDRYNRLFRLSYYSL